MAIQAVIFDVGETLIDESRLWNLWADWLSVPRSTFLETLRHVIERREHHHRVFDLLRPGFILEQARLERAAAGWPPDVAAPEDLYPDAIECLTRLRERGYRIGIAANQPAEIEEVFASLDLSLDLVASSKRWGVEKPSPGFFERIVSELQLGAGEIAYVGDRVDNDVVPAVEAGLKSVFVRRGPWGEIHADWPDVSRAHLRLEDLTDLPRAIGML